MPLLRNRTTRSLLAGLAIAVASLAATTVVSPAVSWAECGPQAGPEGAVDCPPPPAEAPPPFGLPPLAIPPLNPSDVKVNVYPGDTSFSVSPPAVGFTPPQFCLPTIQTPIPFVGFAPCI